MGRRRIAALRSHPGLAALPALLLLLPAVSGESRSPRQPASGSGAGPEITFGRNIAPILQERCQSCHHTGAIAPFPLVTYRDAFERRKGIVKMTGSRRMPPWTVAAGCTEYLDDPSLSAEQISLFDRWVRSGAPEGDPRDLPPAKVFSDWELGEPDLKLVVKAPYKPNFGKGDEYRCFVFPTDVPDDRWVSAVAVLPGNPKMVHHALVWVEKGSASRKLIRNDPAGSYPCFGGTIVSTESIGEWVPGNRPHLFPRGTGRLFPKRSRVIMQIHYSAHYAMRAGTVDPDRTAIGIYFAKEPIERAVVAKWVFAPFSFVIPAGQREFTLKGSLTLPKRTRLIAVWPHMHLLGRTMKATARLPDGREVCLVDVDDWNFHWQRTYWLKTPMELPAGTRVDMVATYDNSAENPDNPSSPPRDVKWGMDTTNEMSQVALYYVEDPRPAGGSRKRAGRRRAPAAPR